MLILVLAAVEEPFEGGSASDYSGEDKIHYTDNGSRRADSEANRKWTYVCPVDGCAQRFNRPCRLETHIRSHNKERPFICPESDCDKTFPRKDHLQRHLKNAHSDPVVERTFNCDWNGCGKSFTSNGRLQRHKDVHDSKFYCTAYPPCNEVFRKVKVLEAHIKSQHLEVKPYPCDFMDTESDDKCTAGYQTEGALRRHVNKAHSEVQKDRHFCMLCVAPGAEAEMLQTALGEAITIPAQPLSFTTKEELMAHTNECHPPVCSECGQKFKNTSNLKSHFDTVHGDPTAQPQYFCPKPDCDSVFNRKHNLTVHIQTVHDKQLRCFCTSDALVNSKHDDLKAWNGENACGAAFKAKSSLDQHVRTHHLGLGTRKDLRKAAKSKKKPEASTLTLLTGIGYEKGREVPCLIKTCEYRFYMDRDLRRHLRSAHAVPEDEIAEMIQERDAMSGGQFWIGGFDEQMNMFESTEPSMPQTPLPHFMSGGVPLQYGVDQPKSIDPQFSFFDPQFDDNSWLNEEAEMDMAMGLNGLPAAMDVQEGLEGSGPAPIDHFNTDHARG